MRKLDRRACQVPAGPVKCPNLAGTPLKADEPTTETGGQLRVLVIDDERDHAETVAEILDAAGYSCATAASGKEGAKKIQAEDFDLVLTDLRMGDLDGLAIVRLVKEHGD